MGYTLLYRALGNGGYGKVYGMWYVVLGVWYRVRGVWYGMRGTSQPLRGTSVYVYEAMRLCPALIECHALQPS